MKITVYTSPDCQPCKATKRKLSALGFAFEEVDLSADDALLAAMKERTGLAVIPMPVVEIDGDIAWHEFRPDKLAELARKETP